MFNTCYREPERFAEFVVTCARNRILIETRKDWEKMDEDAQRVGKRLRRWKKRWRIVRGGLLNDGWRISISDSVQSERSLDLGMTQSRWCKSCNQRLSASISWDGAVHTVWPASVCISRYGQAHVHNLTLQGTRVWYGAMETKMQFHCQISWLASSK